MRGSTVWAEHEFGAAPLSPAVTRRLVSRQRSRRRLPFAAWPARTGRRPTLRLIDQAEDSAVTPEFLAPHRERTCAGCRPRITVLCVQDGADLNFTTHAR